MTRVLDFTQLTYAIDAEAGAQYMAHVPGIGTPAAYGQRTLSKTGHAIEAATALADIEIKQLVDAGYNVSPVNPLRTLESKPGPRFNRLIRAFDTAAEQERFNND